MAYTYNQEDDMKPKIYDNIKCAYTGCDEFAKTQWYCKKHYSEMYRKGIVKPRVLQRLLICSVDNCESSAVIKGMCGKHYQRFRKHNDVFYKENNMHGMTHVPEYNVWAHMISRCYRANTKSYKNYGGRGIKICESWLDSFRNFYADMGSRPSSKHEIDRIDNNGDYEPQNCRWVTRTENARNKRNTTDIESIKEMRAKHKKGISVYRLSKEYAMSYTNAKDIINNRSWKNV